MRVKITKVDIADDPKHPTATWEEYTPGVENQKSLPVEYWIEGELINDVVSGCGVTVARDIRNGEQAFGVFQTSPVVHFENFGKVIKFETLNSKYLLEFL